MSNCRLTAHIQQSLVRVRAIFHKENFVVCLLPYFSKYQASLVACFCIAPLYKTLHNLYHAFICNSTWRLRVIAKYNPPRIRRSWVRFPFSITEIVQLVERRFRMLPVRVRSVAPQGWLL